MSSKEDGKRAEGGLERRDLVLDRLDECLRRVRVAELRWEGLLARSQARREQNREKEER